MRLDLIGILIIVGFCINPTTVYSQHHRLLYVDSKNGDDQNDGLSQTTPWKSLIHAVKNINGGDHVSVAPGVYRGGIQILAKGTPESPIIIEGDARKGNTIITMADMEIRERKLAWTLEDREKGLYSVACKAGPPARVLYSEIDLYPYASLEALNSFTINGNPGPKHGHYYDASREKLYVRLHIDGKYGSLNPDEHLMAVAPPTGGRFDGTLVSQPYHYGIGVIGAGDAHVVIDGFTFETPGVAGVYTEGNYVTVRNSWFQGCRTGVAGNYKDRTTTDPEGKDYFSLRFDPSVVDLSSSHVTIENCDYHQKPSFDDAFELMSDLKNNNSKNEIYGSFWHRKSGGMGLPDQTYTYEIGIAARIGSDWIIRKNDIHDAFEGLSCHAVSASKGLKIEYNQFKRLLDNAVETEDHSSDMHIYRNVIIDVFMPFSWQPIRGTPWPHSIYFTENIIYNTSDYQDMWRDIGFQGRGLFKIGVKASTWQRVPHMVGTQYAKVTVPGDGLILSNNTIIFPGGSLITIQGGRDMPVNNVHIINNIIDTDFLLALDPAKDLREGHFNFENNAVFFSEVDENSPARIVAGSKGIIGKIPNANYLDKNFNLIEGSSSNYQAISVPNLCEKYTYIGAFQPDGNWYPLETGPTVKWGIGVTNHRPRTME